MNTAKPTEVMGNRLEPIEGFLWLKADLSDKVTIDWVKTTCFFDIIGAEVYFDVVPTEGYPVNAREGTIQSENDLTVVIKNKNGFYNRKK